MTTKPDFFSGWVEPQSAANTEYQPIYPYNNATITESGHSFELDDTPKRERIRLTHRTGTFIEMHPNGDEVHKVFGDGYEITIKDKNVLIQGKCNIEILGDANIHVQGDKIEQIDGNYELRVKGTYTQVIDQALNIASGSFIDIKTGPNISGSLTLTVGDCVYFDGDLNVNGEVTAKKITSSGRIDALEGVSAGKLGFVSLEGGLSIGVPIAIPQQIICSGTIQAGVGISSLGYVNAAVNVAAPTGEFGIMTSVLMGDVINSGIYNIHTHPAPKGVTGTPFSPMLEA
jgi:hypothetical protein